MRKDKLYMKLCYEIDALDKIYNPCDFKGGRCYYSRKNNLQETSCCPMTCSQLTNNGCKTKNLMCKIGFGCDVLEQEKFKILKNKIELTRKIAKDCGMHGHTFFMSKEDAIKLI